MTNSLQDLMRLLQGIGQPPQAPTMNGVPIPPMTPPPPTPMAGPEGWHTPGPNEGSLDWLGPQDSLVNTLARQSTRGGLGFQQLIDLMQKQNR